MVVISWQGFYDLVNHLVQTVPFKYKTIHGVSRGGVPLAMELSHRFGLEIVDVDGITEDTLICDDIIDSGATRKKFPYNDFVALVVRDHSIKLTDETTIAAMVASEWVRFPWEIGELDGEDIVRRVLQFIGEDPNRPGLVDTPKRVVKMWKEIFRAYKEDPPNITKFKNGDDGIFYDQLIRDDGYYYSTCEHHMILFTGQYYFAYIPNEWVMGISKIGRVVQYFSARLQIGERLVQQVADYIEQEVQPKGLILVMNGRHFCKEMRGVKMYNSISEMSVVRGCFAEPGYTSCKEEFLSRIK